MYLWLRFLLLLNMCLEFFKLPLAHLQNLSFLEHWPGGGLQWKLNGVTYFVGKNAQITGKFLIKNAVLGVPRWKKPRIFPNKAFYLFDCCSWNVSRSGLNFRNLNLSWKVFAHLVDHYGWLTKEISVLDQLEHSLFQLFHTLKSLYFKAYISFTWHL